MLMNLRRNSRLPAGKVSLKRGYLEMLKLSVIKPVKL